MRESPRSAADPAASQPFGEVRTPLVHRDRIINQAVRTAIMILQTLDFGPEGRAGHQHFNAQPRTWPYRLDLP